PRSAAVGTARTPVALAVVTETSALMPARSPAGGLVSATLTSYETTPPVLDGEADGAMALTVPAIVAASAFTVTVAAWPTWRDGRSDSVKLAVTASGDAAMTIASPPGASAPARMFTAVTVPGPGAVSVPYWIEVARSDTDLAAWSRWARASRSWMSAWRRASVWLVEMPSYVDCALVTRYCAERSCVFAVASCAQRSVVSATARTWSFFTESPTATLTDVTRQDPDDPPEEPFELLEAVTGNGAEPNARAYDRADATVPFPTALSVTSRRATALVRYWLVEAAPAEPRVTTRPTAPSPTARRAMTSRTRNSLRNASQRVAQLMGLGQVDRPPAYAAVPESVLRRGPARDGVGRTALSRRSGGGRRGRSRDARRAGACTRDTRRRRRR